MSTPTDTEDARLGRLEGRMEEQSAAIQDLRAGLREVNSRIDRVFLAMLGIGAAQIALLVTLVVQGS